MNTRLADLRRSRPRSLLIQSGIWAFNAYELPDRAAIGFRLYYRTRGEAYDNSFERICQYVVPYNSLYDLSDYEFCELADRLQNRMEKALESMFES